MSPATQSRATCPKIRRRASSDRPIAIPPEDRLWVPRVALAITFLLAWASFLSTSRWATQPGALHGWRKPWYALRAHRGFHFDDCHMASNWRSGARRTDGFACLADFRWRRARQRTAVASSPSTWLQIPFKDDWTPLFQHAVNGVQLMRRGVIVRWNWWFLGGYPASTDIAQNFAALAFIPMALFGDRGRLSPAACGVVSRRTDLSLVKYLARGSRDEPRRRWFCLLLRGRLLRRYRFQRRYKLPGRCVLCRTGTNRQRCRPKRTSLGRPDSDAGPDPCSVLARRILHLCVDLSLSRGFLFSGSRSGRSPGHRGSPVAGRGAAGPLGIAAISRVHQLQQHGLRSQRSGELVAVRAHCLLQRRDTRVTAWLVQ